MAFNLITFTGYVNKETDLTAWPIFPCNLGLITNILMRFESLLFTYLRQNIFLWNFYALHILNYDVLKLYLQVCQIRRLKLSMAASTTTLLKATLSGFTMVSSCSVLSNRAI